MHWPEGCLSPSELMCNVLPSVPGVWLRPKEQSRSYCISFLNTNCYEMLYVSRHVTIRTVSLWTKYVMIASPFFWAVLRKFSVWPRLSLISHTCGHSCRQPQAISRSLAKCVCARAGKNLLIVLLLNQEVKISNKFLKLKLFLMKFFVVSHLTFKSSTTDLWAAGSRLNVKDLNKRHCIFICKPCGCTTFLVSLTLCLNDPTHSDWRSTDAASTKKNMKKREALRFTASVILWFAAAPPPSVSLFVHVLLRLHVHSAYALLSLLSESGSRFRVEPVVLFLSSLFQNTFFI